MAFRVDTLSVQLVPGAASIKRFDDAVMMAIVRVQTPKTVP